MGTTKVNVINVKMPVTNSEFNFTETEESETSIKTSEIYSNDNLVQVGSTDGDN